MAQSCLRLRRAVSLTSSLIKHQRQFSAVPAITGSPSLSSVAANRQNPSLDLIQPHHHLPFQARSFRSSSAWLSSARSSYRNTNANNDEIGPDTILFEGCDYNHWLITVDFPKDPAPTREEMIETYLQTLAKVVGSYEEAKKKMYAFSTTTYHGFQCLVTEEMSEKFKGLPGVVFVLPDSYIDPVNKEYGGDKYDNGVITPRPPPVQYGRQGGRYGDRNRDFNRNQRRGPTPNQQGNPAYGNQGSMYGGTGNFGQQQNFPTQPNYDNQRPMYGDANNFRQQQNSPMQPNYGNQTPMYKDTRNFEQQQNTPTQPNYVNSGPMSNYGSGGAGDRRDPMPINNAFGGRDSLPSYQGTNSQNQQGYHNPQGGRIPLEQRDYMPPGQWDVRGDNRNYAPPQAVTYGQGAGGNYGGNYGQGAGGNYGQGVGGNYGQGVGAAQMHETGFGYGQTNSGHGEEHRFSQVEQRSNMQGEQRNNAQTGTDQVRY